jgi:N-hydroxyarylamine O-acetyltransferase
VNVRRYLERLRYDGPVAPNAETLHALHRAHLMTVPFEDIDVYLQRRVDLSTASLYDKIVGRNRGGFCYELNGLFAELLRALGFEVSLLNAEVSRQGGGFGPPFDHLALLVELDERWLADVGFPRSSLTPLRLDSDAVQEDSNGAYRIAVDGGTRSLQLRAEEGWSVQYRFDLQPHRVEEYVDTCRFHETSAESPFYGWLGCTLSTPQGRITLSDEKLIERIGDRRTETSVDAADIAQILRERFGIIVDHDWTARPPR